MSMQMSWSALRMEYNALNPAQLHHILREYNSRRSCPAAWTPSSDETSTALRTSNTNTDIHIITHELHTAYISVK